MATVTICVNEVIPTLFCDEEGLDVIPIQMVNVLEIQEECNLEPDFKEDPSLGIELNHVKIDNQISSFDLSLGHETQGTSYYDASDELENWDLQKNQNEHVNPVIFRTREGKDIELPDYPHPKHGAVKNIRKRKPKRQEQKLRTAPSILGKQDYLTKVRAKDCQKNKITGCYKVEPTRVTKDTPRKQKEIKTTTQKSKKTMTKLERK